MESPQKLSIVNAIERERIIANTGGYFRGNGNGSMYKNCICIFLMNHHGAGTGTKLGKLWLPTVVATAIAMVVPTALKVMAAMIKVIVMFVVIVRV